MIPKYAEKTLPSEVRAGLLRHLAIERPPRLRSARDAAELVNAARLVTLTGGTELPSLEEAATGRPCRSGRARYPLISSQVWEWAGALLESEDFFLLRLFRGRPTLIARPLLAQVGRLAVQRSEWLSEQRRLSIAASSVANFIRLNGPVTARELLEIMPRRVPIFPRSVRMGLEELERDLLIYPRSLVGSRDGAYTAVWELTGRGLAAVHGTAQPNRAGNTSLGALLGAAVEAAGIFDPQEVRHWFPAFGSSINASPLAAAGGDVCTDHTSLLAVEPLISHVRPAA